MYDLRFPHIMKTELTIISDDLNHGVIDEKQARNLLLDLLGVSGSFSTEDMEKSFKEGYNLALHHYKEYLSKEIVGYDFSKDEPKDFYTFIKNYI